MARIRSVHPELFLDDAFMELSPAARLLWIGIWTQADDHGIFEWKPNYLKATILPVDPVVVVDLLAELERLDCIKPFEDGGRRYGAVRNFCLYQRPKKPVYKHAFPDWCRTYAGLDRRKARDDANKSPTDTPPKGNEAPAPIPRRGEERKGREEDNSSTSIESGERVAPAKVTDPPAAPSDSLSKVSEKVLQKIKPNGLKALGTQLSAEWIPDDDLCEEVSNEFGMTAADIHTELLAFHAHHAASGAYSANWRASFVTWCKRWKEHRDKQAPPRLELNRAAPKKPEELSEAAWDGIVKLYAQTGRWGRDVGPDPMHVGACKAPRHILERHGINIETGERQIPPRKVSA